jgi:hypothetical protein
MKLSDFYKPKKVKVHRLAYWRPDPEKYMETWLVEVLPPIEFMMAAEDVIDVQLRIAPHLPQPGEILMREPLYVEVCTGWSLEE